MKCLKTLPKSILDNDGFIKKSLVETLKFATANKRDPIKKFLALELGMDLKAISANQFKKQMCEHLVSPEVRCKIAERIDPKYIEQNANNLFRVMYDVLIKNNKNLDFFPEDSEERPYTYTRKSDDNNFLNISAFKRFAELLKQGKASEEEIDQIIWAWSECHLLRNASFGNRANKTPIADQLDQHLIKNGLMDVLTWDVEVFEESKQTSEKNKKTIPSPQRQDQECNYTLQYVLHRLDWGKVKELGQSISNIQKFKASFEKSIAQLKTVDVGVTKIKDSLKLISESQKCAQSLYEAGNNLIDERKEVRQTLVRAGKGGVVIEAQDVLSQLPHYSNEILEIIESCSLGHKEKIKVELSITDELFENIAELNQLIEECFASSSAKSDQFLESYPELISSFDQLFPRISLINEGFLKDLNRLVQLGVGAPVSAVKVENELDPCELFEIGVSYMDLLSARLPSFIREVEGLYKIYEELISEREIGNLDVIRIDHLWESYGKLKLTEEVGLPGTVDPETGDFLFILIPVLCPLFEALSEVIPKLKKLPLSKNIEQLCKEYVSGSQDNSLVVNIVRRLFDDKLFGSAFLLVRSFFNDTQRDQTSPEIASELFTIYLSCWRELAQDSALLMLDILNDDHHWMMRVEKKITLKDPALALIPIHLSLLHRKRVEPLALFIPELEQLFSKNPDGFNVLSRIGRENVVGFYSSSLTDREARKYNLSEIKKRYQEKDGEIFNVISSIKEKRFREFAEDQANLFCDSFIKENAKAKSMEEVLFSKNAYLSDKLPEFEEKSKQLHKLKIRGSSGPRRVKQGMPNTSKQKLTRLLETLKHFVEDASDFFSTKLLRNAVAIDEEIENVISSHIGGDLYELSPRSDIHESLPKIIEAVSGTNGNCLDFEFFHTFPATALSFPLGIIKVLQASKSIDELSPLDLISELSDTLPGKSAESLLEARCFRQALSLKSLEDQEDAISDLRRSFEDQVKDRMSRIEVKCDEIYEDIFRLRLHPLAETLISKEEKLDKERGKKKQMEADKKLEMWVEQCRSITTSIDEELRGVDEPDHRIILIKDRLIRKIWKNEKGKETDDELLKDLECLHFAIQNDVDVLKPLEKKYLPKELRGSKFIDDEVEGPEEVIEDIPNEESLEFLMEGYDEESCSGALKEQFQEMWKKLSNIVNVRFDLIRIKSIWEVGQLNLPAALFKFRRPNCEYLNVNSISLYFYPEKEPFGYGNKLKEQIRSDSMKNTIPICIVEKVSGNDLRKQARNKKLIQLTVREFSEILNDENPSSALKRRVFRGGRPSDLYSFSPFVSSDAIDDKVSFFHGRKEKIEELIANPASVLCAGRRIGKSTLLVALGKELNDKYGHKVVHVEVTDKTDENDIDFDSHLAAEITQDLLSKLPPELASNIRESTSGTRLSVLNETLRMALQAKIKVSVLLDEFDRYLNHHYKKNRKKKQELDEKAIKGEITQKEADSNNPLLENQTYPLVDILRATKKIPGFKLVIAGFKNLYHMYENKERTQTGYSLGNIGELVQLEEWTPQDALDFLTLTFHEHLGIKIEPYIAMDIIQHGSTTPAFLQKFARDLVISNYTKGEKFKEFREGNATVSADEVWATFNDTGNTSKDAFQDFVDTTLGWNLSGLGRVILLTILNEIKDACDGRRIKRKTPDDMLTKSFFKSDIKGLVKKWVDAAELKCAGKQLELEDDEFDQTLDMLIMTNVLKQETRKKIKVASPSYTRILGILEKSEKQEIDKEIEKFSADKEKYGSGHIFFN